MAAALEVDSPYGRGLVTVMAEAPDVASVEAKVWTPGDGQDVVGLGRWRSAQPARRLLREDACTQGTPGGVVAARCRANADMLSPCRTTVSAHAFGLRLPDRPPRQRGEISVPGEILTLHTNG